LFSWRKDEIELALVGKKKLGDASEHGRGLVLPLSLGLLLRRCLLDLRNVIDPALDQSRPAFCATMMTTGLLLVQLVTPQFWLRRPV
jgi:hypothetical protein